MRRIDIKLSLPVVAPLLDVMRDACSGLRGSLASPVIIDTLDNDMREIWSEDLLQSQNSELKQFLDLFDSEFFSTGMLRIDEEHADVIMRATASLRLQLRMGALKGITDELLEEGRIDPEKLPVPQQGSFLCYIFLASLQELMIQHMSGEASEEPNGESSGEPSQE